MKMIEKKIVATMTETSMRKYLGVSDKTSERLHDRLVRANGKFEGAPWFYSAKVGSVASSLTVSFTSRVVDEKRLNEITFVKRTTSVEKL